MRASAGSGRSTARPGGAERAAIIRLALGVEDITISDVERLDTVFPHAVHIDAHLLPSISAADFARSVRAPAFMITGWYDWCLDDALRTWELLAAHGRDEVRASQPAADHPVRAQRGPATTRARRPHPELDRIYRHDPALILYWHDAVRAGSVAALPAVTYYLMGANQWYAASEWPPAAGPAARAVLRARAAP